MAYIVITSSENSLKLTFGNYAGQPISSGIIPIARTFQKQGIEFSYLNNNLVEAIVDYNRASYPLSYNGATGTLKIDSVNGTTPNSNKELYYLLENLV
jgi:hypothetical protein